MKFKKKEKIKTLANSFEIHDHHGIIKDENFKNGRYGRNLKYCTEFLTCWNIS